MKQLPVLFQFVFLFYANTLFAQNSTNWFQPGAKWAYKFESPFRSGEEYFDLVGHEIVGGELCAKLHNYGFDQLGVFIPFDNGFRYFFARNDSVFLWSGNAFNLLYDFNRMAGDTFSIPTGIYEHGEVINTGNTFWKGIPVRFQDLELSSYSFWPDGDTLFLTTRIYDRIGGTHLIYWDIESPLTEIQYSLECYREDQFPVPGCPFNYDPSYESFPQVGTSEWSELDGLWCGFGGFQYKAEGDTAIAGLGKGKKVYFRNTYIGNHPCPDAYIEIIHEPFRLIGLLNQEIKDKKVYFARLTDDTSPFPFCVSGDLLPLNEYKLLYDFDLEIGDTVHWKPQPNVVEAIDSIQMDDGTWRRTFLFDQNPYYWIEGLGTNLGLFGAFANIQVTDVFCNLQCFRYNNLVKYSTVDAIFCDSVAVATYEPNDFNNTLKLYPNPSSGKTTLEIPASETPAMLRVFDAQGRELGRIEVTETQSQPDFSRWHENAVLFLQISGASGQMAGRVLRIE